MEAATAAQDTTVYIDTRELSRRTPYCQEYLRRLARAGKLPPAVRLGGKGKLLFKEAEVLRFLEELENRDPITELLHKRRNEGGAIHAG